MEFYIMMLIISTIMLKDSDHEMGGHMEIWKSKFMSWAFSQITQNP